MDPTPGKRFVQETNSIIQPDINIFYDNGNLRIELNNEYIPKLRINQKYKDLLLQAMAYAIRKTKYKRRFVITLG